MEIEVPDDWADGHKPMKPSQNIHIIGGIAALFVAVLTVLEIILFVLYPPPDTIVGWYELFQTTPIRALVSFWGLELPMHLAFGLVFLSLFVVLKDKDWSMMAISLLLATIGIAVFLATNNPFVMVTLSTRFSSAVTEIQKSQLIAAGEAVLAGTNQRAIGGFNIGLLLINISGLIVSLDMLKDPSFRRSTGIIGVLAFVFSLADYLRQAITSSPIIAVIFILPGAIMLVVWCVVVGITLFRLGQTNPALAAHSANRETETPQSPSAPGPRSQRT